MGDQDDAVRAMAELTRALGDLERAVTTSGVGKGSAPQGSSKGPGGDEDGGGALGMLAGGGKGGLGALAGAAGGGLVGIAASAGAAVADWAKDTGFKALEGGLASWNDGGSFLNGSAAAINSAIADIPILGELTGAAQTRDVAQGAERDLNKLTNEIARFGGTLSDGVRGFAANQLIDQNARIENDRDSNRLAIEARLDRAAQGQANQGVLREVLGWGRTVNDVSTNGGARQHM